MKNFRHSELNVNSWKSSIGPVILLHLGASWYRLLLEAETVLLIDNRTIATTVLIGLPGISSILLRAHHSRPFGG